MPAVVHAVAIMYRPWMSVFSVLLVVAFATSVIDARSRLPAFVTFTTRARMTFGNRSLTASVSRFPLVFPLGAVRKRLPALTAPSLTVVVPVKPVAAAWAATAAAAATQPTVPARRFRLWFRPRSGPAMAMRSSSWFLLRGIHRHGCRRLHGLWAENRPDATKVAVSRARPGFRPALRT